MEVVPRLHFLGPIIEGNETELYLPRDHATCEALDPGAKWMGRAISRDDCESWYGCCLSSHGDVCAQYSGDIFRDNNTEARNTCEACGGTWSRIFEWAGRGTWREGRLNTDPVGQWTGREWVSANEWRETLDLEKVRLKIENALEISRSQARLNLVKCRFDMLRKSIRVVAESCGTAGTTQWYEGDKLVPAAPLGRVIAMPGTVSGRSLLFGRVSLFWHEYSVAEPTTIDTSIVFFEFQQGHAAPKFVLPGVLEMEQLKVGKVEETTTSTTTKTIFGSTMKVGSQEYPQWLIDWMRVTTTTPRPVTMSQEELQAMAIAAAAELAEMATNSLGDIWNAFLNAVASFLRMKPAGMAPEAMRVDIADSCSNVVVNWQGRVVGKVIGDCVEINADKPLVNGVELCVPIRPSMDKNHTHFTTYDFARKRTVQAYTRNSLAIVEDVPVNGDYGRLLPGWSIFEPLQRTVHSIQTFFYT